MSNIQRAIVMAAGISLSIALVTIAVVIFRSGQEVTIKANNSFTNIQSELSYIEYSTYDGTTVSGSQVINAIRKFQYYEPFAIQVKTKSNSAGYWYLYTASVSGDTVTIGTKKGVTVGVDLQNNALNPSNSNYVNPTGKFASRIYTDGNDVIRAIVFTQQ